jgi:Bacterial nucleoid DNA-binding protein
MTLGLLNSKERVPMAKSKRMSKAGLTAAIAEKMNISKTDAKAFLEELAAIAEDEIQHAGEFVIPDIVKVQIRDRKSRMGRNPATGEEIRIPAKRVIKARPLKNMKDLLG